MPETKRCKRCSRDRLTTSFYKDSTSPDGLQFYCKSCSKRFAKKTYKKNAKFILAAAKKRYAEKSPHLTKYGLTKPMYECMMQSQNNTCAICQGLCSTGKKLAVDHDHSTGKVRGLLCRRCNQTLGAICDSQEWLEAAIAYLRIAASR